MKTRLPIHALSYCLALAAVIIIYPDANAENWPNWRGPRGDGTVNDRLPMQWD